MSELEIKNLSKSFGESKVLDDVSLSVEKGDIYGILGLSGAGKSTLLRCINGLERYESGEIYFEGKLLSSPDRKIEKDDVRKIGMIFQSFNLLEQKSVFQNVKLALDLDKTKRSKLEKEELVKEALKRVNLLDKINSYPSELSGGQKQRVAIARVLVLRPKIILSDESTSALDPENTQSILELLKELNKELGLTLIMISHQLNVIESICNKVAILDKAKIVEEGNLSDVFLNPKTEISKKMIYANHVNTLFAEDKFIRILFNGNIDEPVISNIVQDLNISVSIVFANTKVVENKAYGQTVIKAPEKEEEKNKLFAYLKLHNLSYEEVDSL